MKSTDQIASGIRRRVFEHTLKNDGGYLSQACSSAEMVAALYNDILNLGPSIAPAVPKPFNGTPRAGKPSETGAGYHGEFASDKDRFFISPAHYALIIYAALIEVERMAPEGLDQFNMDGGRVEMIGAEHSPGMEVTNGSLAQTLSVASGVAWARKRRGDSGIVWVMMSDGEFQEGQTWECLQAMSYHKLDNIRIIADVNGQQCDGAMEDVMSLGDIQNKLDSFGMDVHRVNGHSVNDIVNAAKKESIGKPVVILADTNPWQGIDILKKRSPRLHYVRFLKAEEKEELAEAGGKQLGIKE